MEEQICKIEKQGDIAIMTLTLDNILWDDNQQLKKEFTSLLDGGSKNIILDLSKTTYISSVVLASFVYMLKSAKESGGNLVICNINKRVEEVLSITNLDKVFDIARDKEEAISRFSKRS